MTKTEFIPEVIESTKSAFSQMMNLQLELVKIHENTGDEDAYCLDVTTCMGLTGMDTLQDNTLRGVILATFTKDFAISLISTLLGATITGVNSDVRDGIAEIANIIAGGTKTRLQKKNIDIGLSIPYTITGKDHDLSASISKARTRIEFAAGSEIFFLDCIF